MARFKVKFHRNYDFLERHVEKFNFSGALPREFEYDPDGPNARDAFYSWESDCILLATSEPEELQRIYNTKGAINFALKMWAEGFADMMEPVEYYLAEFDRPPNWVRKSLVGLIKRIHGKNAPNWFRYGGEEQDD